MNTSLTKLVLVLCTLAQLQLNAQVTQSFTTAGDKGWDMLSDIAFDAEGNYYRYLNTTFKSLILIL